MREQSLYEQRCRHNNIHTLSRKLLHTKIPDTIIKFIANYIKGRKAYTTYRSHTFSQRQLKTGVPQGGVFSPTLFNMYTTDIQPPRSPVQVTAYAYDITITSTPGYGPYIRPKTHIQHTHSQHLSTSTHATTNDKSPLSNRMGQSWDRLWNIPLPYGCLLYPRPALTNCKVDAKSHLSPLCPLCNTRTHHLFNCTTLSTPDLLTDPVGVTALLAIWTEKLAGGPQAGRLDSPH